MELPKLSSKNPIKALALALAETETRLVCACAGFQLSPAWSCYVRTSHTDVHVSGCAKTHVRYHVCQSIPGRV